MDPYNHNPFKKNGARPADTVDLALDEQTLALAAEVRDALDQRELDRIGRVHGRGLTRRERQVA